MAKRFKDEVKELEKKYKPKAVLFFACCPEGDEVSTEYYYHGQGADLMAAINSAIHDDRVLLSLMYYAGKLAREVEDGSDPLKIKEYVDRLSKAH